MSENEVPLIEVIRAVSSLVRTGWMLRGVRPALGETVAEHSFAAALIAFDAACFLSKKGINIDPYRAAVIALIHDLGESLVGDIPRVAGINNSEKKRVEMDAFNKIINNCNIKELFIEFEKRNTIEAKTARFAELTATLIKSLEYQSIGFNVDDIRENMLKEAKNLAGELGLVNYLYRLLNLPAR